MRAALKRFFLFSFSCLTIFETVTIQAQQSTVTITRGPYLQMPGPSNIVVRWRTEEFTDSRVRCGTSLNLSRVFDNNALTREHEVRLSNLQPDTTYYYVAGDRRLGPLGNPDMHFKTAPITGASSPVRIWFVSDYGYIDFNEIAVRDSIYNFISGSHPPDVWLTGGDNDQINGGDDTSQIAIFNTYSNLLRTTPIWPSLGNHDASTPSTPGPCPFYDNFTLPTNGESGGVPSGSEFYFSFDYGNVHFISLNSIYAEHSVSTNTAMLQWLVRDLAATRQPWKIAFWHAPPYTKGTHDSDAADDTDGYMVQMRENALPLLESYGVDLVLNGHSHVYERSYLLNGHYGYSTSFSETNKVDRGDGRENGDGAYHKRGKRGAVYVVAAVGSISSRCPCGQHPAHCITLGGQLGSCMVDINSNRLDFKFIGVETNILDYFTIIKTPAPRITAIEYAATSIGLTWDSVPGEVYQVYWQPTLNDTPVVISEDIHAVSASTSWSGRVNSADSIGFYFVALAQH